MMYYKIVDDRMVTTINFMSTTFSDLKEAKFLGFIENTSDYANLGVDINNKNYVACYIFWSETNFYTESQDDAYNTPWILMFAGNDDSSYYKRFSNKKSLEQYYSSLNAFSNQIYENCLYFN